MLDNQTPFDWRRAAGAWFLLTVWWGTIWMIPFFLISSSTRGSGLLLLGSLGLPFIGGYLLFRTVARMIDREWTNDEPTKDVSNEGSAASTTSTD